MEKILGGMVWGLAFAGFLWAAEPTCPVMKGERVKKKFWAEWKGEKVYFCCRSCVKSFKKHPERYPVSV